MTVLPPTPALCVPRPPSRARWRGHFLECSHVDAATGDEAGLCAAGGLQVRGHRDFGQDRVSTDKIRRCRAAPVPVFRLPHCHGSRRRTLGWRISSRSNRLPRRRPYSDTRGFSGERYNGSNLTLGRPGSAFWRWRFLSGPSLPLLRRRPRHDIGDRYYRPSLAGLTRSLTTKKRPPRLAASSFRGSVPALFPRRADRLRHYLI